MPTEIESSYLVTSPANLESAGVDISTRRKSLDNTKVIIDLYCLTVQQINCCLKEENQISSFDDIRNSTVVIVNTMMKEGYVLYTMDDACALMQTPEWSNGW
jgi:hypothetical protein